MIACDVQARRLRLPEGPLVGATESMRRQNAGYGRWQGRPFKPGESWTAFPLGGSRDQAWVSKDRNSHAQEKNGERGFR